MQAKNKNKKNSKTDGANVPLDAYVLQLTKMMEQKLALKSCKTMHAKDDKKTSERCHQTLPHEKKIRKRGGQNEDSGDNGRRAGSRPGQ